MKKQICAVLSLALLATGASAYQMRHTDRILYGTVEDWEINNDPDLQTGMLEKLGLLTGAGWRLDQPMTRAEGAVMLCQFLGGADKVSAGGWKHPFTDVPAWAEGAVGWLYQSGLLAGISDTAFGADQTITAEQFARVLSRALGGDDSRIDKVLTDTERFTFADSEPARFLRIDAVRMCTRALAQSANEGEPTLAQRCVSQGRFTAAQFLEAAWNIFSPVFDREMNAEIAGVRYASRAGEGFVLDRASAAQECENPYFYATREENGKTAFYRFDCKTLKETALGTAAHPAGYQMTLGGTDYLWGDTETGGLLLAVSGDQAAVALDEAALAGAKPPAEMEYGRGLTITAGSTIYEVTGSGIRRQEISGEKKRIWADEKSQIVQIVNPQQTFLQWTDLSGERVLRSYSVPQDSAGNPREVHPKAEGSAVLVGEAGLYVLDSRGFHQYYDQPVLDFIYSDRYFTYAYCITHDPGVRIPGADGYGGNKLVKIPFASMASEPEPAETLIGTELGMEFMEIDIDSMFYWGKVTLSQKRPAAGGSKGFTYDFYFDGGIKVTDYHGSEQESADKASLIAAEQARLDALLKSGS